MQIIFETARLSLREFTAADAPLILELNSDPEVIKYLHEPTVQSELHAKDILTDIILPQYKKKVGRWAIYTKQNEEFIGWCGLKSVEETAEIDLGYRLKRSAWGKGYAKEAAKETLNYGFNKLQLQVITGKAQCDNIASIKILEKIGMSFIKDTIEDAFIVKVFEATALSNVH